MSYTFGDSLTFLLYNNRQASSTVDDYLIRKISNDACYAFHCGNGRLFDFDQREFYYSLPALYDTGTVSVTVGSGTCTGSGTTFTSAMVGRYIRIAGQFTQFLITAYSSATSITIQPNTQSSQGYIGPENLSGATYQITQERVALPANFRSMYSAQVDYVPQYLRGGFTRDQILYWRKYGRECSFPRSYATEDDANLTAASAITSYLMLYPSASQQMNLQVFAYLWPTECTADADEFGVGATPQPMPSEAYPALRQMQLAFLRKQQGDPNWQAEMAKAEAMTNDLLGSRNNQEIGAREMWTLAGDDGGQSLRYPVPFGNVLAPS